MSSVFNEVNKKSFLLVNNNCYSNPKNIAVRKQQNGRNASDSKTLEWVVGMSSGAVLLGFGVLKMKKLPSGLSRKPVQQAEHRLNNLLPENIETCEIHEISANISAQNVSPKPVLKKDITPEPITMVPQKEKLPESEQVIAEVEKEKLPEPEQVIAEVEKEKLPESEQVITKVEKDSLNEAEVVPSEFSNEKIKDVEKPLEDTHILANAAVRLEETAKTYRPHDITVFGFYNGEWIKGNDSAIIDKNLISKLKKLDTAVFYDESEKSTQIVMPYGENFYSIKINGIVSEKRAIDAARSVNAFGLANPADFSHVIVRSLNKGLNELYSTKSIGISYDFHDKGYKVYKGGGEMYARDGRILLRKAIKEDEPWEGTHFCYYNDGQRAATDISVALPSESGERAKTNNYTISLAGFVSPVKCKELIEHLNSKVIKNPADVKESELPFIQEEVLKFINAN